jgi:hypothetical protein
MIFRELLGTKILNLLGVKWSICARKRMFD